MSKRPKDSAEVGAAGGPEALRQQRESYLRNAIKPDVEDKGNEAGPAPLSAADLAALRALLDNDEGQARKKKRPYLQVDRLEVQTSDPPIYRLTIGAHTFAVTSSQLMSRNKLQQRVMEVCGYIPHLPQQAKSTDYVDWLNELLARAIKIEAPPEASTGYAERVLIAEAIRGMPEAEADDNGEEALQRGCVVTVDGGHLLQLVALHRTLRASLPRLAHNQLADHLRALGWSPTRKQLGPRQVRAWRGSRDQGDDT